MDPDITNNNNEMDPVLKTVSLQRRSDVQKGISTKKVVGGYFREIQPSV